MARVFLGLGANLGEPRRQLRAAAARLGQVGGILVRRGSSLYESAPVGPVSEQPSFLNAVLELETDLDPRALLRITRALEDELGRTREVAKGPRLIDLDLLLHGDRVAAWPELVLPHPELTRRAFVLQPLLELDPGLRDPRDGRPLQERLSEVSDQRIRRLDEPLL